MSKTGKADARQISSSISTDARLARLSSWKGRFLFIYMIPHADDQGRLTGDPVEIKLRVVPLEPEITYDDIEQCLQEMQDLELIIWYDAGGQKIIQLRNWWKHQSRMRWKYPSSYPAPDGWVDWLRYRDRVDGKTQIIEQGAHRHGFVGVIEVDDQCPTMSDNGSQCGANGALKLQLQPQLQVSYNGAAAPRSVTLEETLEALKAGDGKPQNVVAHLYQSRFGNKHPPNYGRLGKMAKTISGGYIALAELIWDAPVPNGDPHDYLTKMAQERGIWNSRSKVKQGPDIVGSYSPLLEEGDEGSAQQH